MDTSNFTLRRLELAFPHLEAAQNNDPKALKYLSAIALADEGVLKQLSAGNDEPFKLVMEQVADMAIEEVGQALGFFIRGSQRFSLVLSGLSPDEVNQVTAAAMKKMREAHGLISESPESSPKRKAASSQP